ncbi:MAG: hypothetical protein JSS50_03985 [Proteobacteria bacterium]|nr:hypothetical protein [Pseudomonadota bacterium]
MYRTPLQLLLACFAALCIYMMDATLCWAQDTNVFTIENVEASAIGDSLEEAKYQAQENGMRQAAHQLLLRMLPRNLYSRIPHILQKFDRDEWVSDYQATRERMTSTSYQATFTVNFAPNKIQLAMLKQGVRFGKKWADPTLLIPTTEEPEPDWLAAWTRAPRLFGLSRMVIPLSDLEDLELLEQAVEPRARYLKVMQKYNCPDLTTVQLVKQELGIKVLYTKFLQGKTVQHTASYKREIEQDKQEFYDAVVYDLQSKIDAEQKGMQLW